MTNEICLGDEDCVLPHGQSTWITVGNLSVNVKHGVWGGDQLAISVVQAVIRGLRPDSVDYLPLYHIQKVVSAAVHPAPEQEKHIDELVLWLASGSQPLFDKRFEFQPPDGADIEIAPEDITRAIREGVLVVPETGQEYRDFLGSVFPYFVGTPLLRTILRERESGATLERQ
jgi:hypothetical protein